MGLFGFNAEKKLAKGNEHLAKGFYYEARITYEEILAREGISDEIRAQAKEGRRAARLELIAGQCEEARRLLAAGDTDAAAESCRAAIDLAEEDLDVPEAKAMLELIVGPPETRRSAILAGLDEEAAAAVAETVPVRQIEHARPEEVVTGGEADELFEVYLNAFSNEVADRYRALGTEFRGGYLLLQEGKPGEALAQFESVPAEMRDDSLFRMEKAQALLVAEDNEAALATLEGVVPPAEMERRRSEMRIILLDRLKRHEEAEGEAERLWSTDRQNPEAALLYAEILNGRCKHDEAIAILKPMINESRPQPEVDSLAAQSYRGLGKNDDARSLLERAVERFFQGGYATGDMQRFPIWAGRELLDLYITIGEEAEKIRSLAQHLIRHDPANANGYKDALAQYAKRFEE